MEHEGEKSSHFFRRIGNIIQMVIGCSLALGMGVFLNDNVEQKLFVPVFVILPMVLLIILNLLSIKRNLPLWLKTFGLVAILFLVALFIRKSWSYYHLVGRKLPIIVGLAGMAVIFLLLFIILLKPVSTSIKGALATGFLLGLYLPAFFWNINVLYDGGTAVTYTTKVKRVISDYGVLGGRIELVKAPVEQMDKIIYLFSDISEYEKDDEIHVVYHPGIFGAGWCEIE